MNAYSLINTKKTLRRHRTLSTNRFIPFTLSTGNKIKLVRVLRFIPSPNRRTHSICI